MRFLVFYLFVFFSSNLLSSEWSQFEEINFTKSSVKIEQNISDIVGSINPTAWLSTASFEGEEAAGLFIENYSDKGFLLIDHVKFPPAWVIRKSGNDKKYISMKTAWLLNVDDRDNPLKKIRKKEITRYRDLEDNVVAYVHFKFENSGCVVFKKGYYTQESGYVTAADDDETLVALFCSNNDTFINDSDVEGIIEGINVKQRR